MAADANGFDVAAVGIPLTGKIAFAAYGTTLPTPAEMFNPAYVLPTPTWVNPGLLTTDGGFAYDEQTSTPIEFCQDGYELTVGTGVLTLAVRLAETSEAVRKLTRGKTADGNGTIEVDIDGSPLRYCVYTHEEFKNGNARRRAMANAWVRSWTQDKSTRGDVNGGVLTLAIKRHAAHGGGHFRETLIPLDTTPNPFITSITPAGLGVGGKVLVQGYNLSSITSMTFDGVTVTSGANRVEMNDGAVLVTIPTGAAGASDVVITTAAGTSNTVSYTVV